MKTISFMRSASDRVTALMVIDNLTFRRCANSRAIVSLPATRDACQLRRANICPSFASTAEYLVYTKPSSFGCFSIRPAEARQHARGDALSTELLLNSNFIGSVTTGTAEE